MDTNESERYWAFTFAFLLFIEIILCQVIIVVILFFYFYVWINLPDFDLVEYILFSSLFECCLTRYGLSCCSLQSLSQHSMLLRLLKSLARYSL